MPYLFSVLPFSIRRAAFQIGGLIREDPLEIIKILEAGPRNFYRMLYVKKKGKNSRGRNIRVIYAPAPILKRIQKKLYRKILVRVKPPPEAHGYTMKRSIITNAVPHIRAKSFIHIDLSNAFDSVNFDRLLYRDYDGLRYDMASKIFGVQEDAVRIIRMLVEVPENLKGTNFRFRQGPPTSPWMFNLAMSKLYRRLREKAENIEDKLRNEKIQFEQENLRRKLTAAEKRKIKATIVLTVTGYADNFVISSTEQDIDPKTVQGFINIFGKEGLFINRKKSMVRWNANTPNCPVRLPGINIINGELCMPPKIIDRFRQRLFLAGKAADFVTRHGIESYCISVYGELPSRLKDQFDKGYYSTHPKYCP